MKAQFDARSLRLRLTEADLTQLLDGETLSLSPALCGRALFDLQVVLGERLSFDAQWRLTLPRDAMEAHAAALPSRDGLAFDVDPSLQLVVDVDVRDSLAVRGAKRR